MNIKQLAKHLGLSIATVSRALNGRQDVSAQTQERVLLAAQSLGYSPNIAGRNLRKGRMNTVILMLPAGNSDDCYSSSFFMRIACGLQASLKSAGIDVILHVSMNMSEEMIWLRNVVEQNMTDALILTDTKINDSRIPFLNAHSFPFVMLGRSNSQDENTHWVDFDFAKLAALSTRRFITQGHTRIALSSLGNQSMQGMLFTQSYRDTMSAYGLEIDENLISEGELNEKSGFQSADKWLTSTNPPTAAVFINDLQAVGAFFRMKKHPLQTSLPSFFGIISSDISSFIEPSPSGCVLPLHLLGEALADAVLHALQHPKDMAVQRLFDVKITEGLSHSYIE